MAYQLDINTTFITLAVGHLFSAFLISIYWYQQKGDKTLACFVAAKCLQALAWLLLVMRGGVPDPATILAANSMLLLGVSLESIAILRLQNRFRPGMRKLYVVLTAASMAGFLLIVLFRNEETLRVALASIGTAALLLPAACMLIKTKDSTLLAKTMGYLLLSISSVFLARGATALLSGPSMSLFTPGGYQTFSFLALYLVMISGNTGFVLLMKQRADQALWHAAHYDDLTGVLNRRAFIDRATSCLAAASRKKQPLSLLLFDVDQFKSINDTYGHDEGDRVLRDLAKQIMPLLGSADGFSRYGGDEFAVLLPGSDEAASDERAEAIRRSVMGAAGRGLEVEYSVSVGVLTVIPGEPTQLEALYALCDKALYRAKSNGRNCVFRGDPALTG